jgi:hypothetical protein
MNKIENKEGSSSRIAQTIRIPTNYAEIKVDTSREKILNLISRLTEDEEFRVQFNKNPSNILQDTGIFLDDATLKRLECSPITNMVRDMSPQPTAIIAAIVIVGVIVGVIAPPKPAD